MRPWCAGPSIISTKYELIICPACLGMDAGPKPDCTQDSLANLVKSRVKHRGRLCRRIALNFSRKEFFGGALKIFISLFSLSVICSGSTDLERNVENIKRQSFDFGPP
jgi:hypothetical protein